MTEHHLAAMDVVVLAGGRGTRLGDLLGDLPKILAPIGDRPYLAHLLSLLSRFGATRIVLCLGHLAKRVEAYLALHPPVNLAVSSVVEPQPLGTAGAIRFARPHLRTGAVLLVNGDSFVDADLDDFIGRWKRSGADIGLLCAEVDNAGRYGSVELDGDGFVRRFVEKDATTTRGIVSAGFAVLSSAALERIDRSHGPSLEHDILAAMPPHSIWAHVARGAFIDIGTPESLAQAEAVILPLSRPPGAIRRSGRAEVKRFLRAIVPAPMQRVYDARASAAKAGRRLPGIEKEALFLPTLCRRDRTAVDVGGNEGSYAWHLRRLAAALHIFEPIPDLATRLRAAFALNPSVHVHPVALSDHEGHATLRIPLDRNRPVTGLATIDAENALRGLETMDISVRLARLDDIDVGHVGFIKIDVEGHELAVLRGAMRTLQAYHPNLLIEAADQNRPNAMPPVAELLAPLGYRGQFLWEGELRSLDDFDPPLHQPDGLLDPLSRVQSSRAYVYNFIFRCGA